MLGVLGWAPQVAWGATIPEIRAAAAARLGPGHALPDRSMLAALMAAFPDDPSTGEPDGR